MIKLISAKMFCGAVEVDNQDKIINAPPYFKNFINLPFSILEETLKRKKFHSIQIDNVEES